MWTLPQWLGIWKQLWLNFIAVWWWQPNVWPWRPRSLQRPTWAECSTNLPPGPNCNKTGRVYLNLSTLDLVPALLATSNFLLTAQSIHPMPSRSAVDHLHKFQNQRRTILMWRWRWLWGWKKRKKWEKNFLSCLHVKSTRGLGGVGGTAALLGSATLPSSIFLSWFLGFQVSTNIYASRFSLAFSSFDNFLGGSFSPGCFTSAGLIFFNVDGNLFYGFYGHSMGVKIYNFNCEQFTCHPLLKFWCILKHICSSSFCESFPHYLLNKDVGTLQQIALSCVSLVRCMSDALHWYFNSGDHEWLLWHCSVGLSEKVKHGCPGRVRVVAH